MQYEVRLVLPQSTEGKINLKTEIRILRFSLIGLCFVEETPVIKS